MIKKLAFVLIVLNCSFCLGQRGSDTGLVVTDSFTTEKSITNIWIPESKKKRKKRLIKGYKDSMFIYIMEFFNDTIEVLMEGKMLYRGFAKTNPSISYTGISIPINTDQLKGKEVKIIFRLPEKQVQAIFTIPDKHYVELSVSRSTNSGTWYFRLSNYWMKMM